MWRLAAGRELSRISVFDDRIREQEASSSLQVNSQPA
jgi:hypothetical protein